MYGNDKLISDYVKTREEHFAYLNEPESDSGNDDKYLGWDRSNKYSRNPNPGDESETEMAFNIYVRERALEAMVEENNASPEMFGGAEPLDFEKLFELVKTSEKENKRFGIHRQFFDVKIAPLRQIFDNAQSTAILPKAFEALLKIVTKDFEANDRLIMELSCDGLNPNIYLHVRKFQDFDVSQLLVQWQKLNSSRKFNIDESFFIRLTRSRLPGDSGRVHIHSSVDRRRMATSVVSVHADGLCLPTALYLGRF